MVTVVQAGSKTRVSPGGARRRGELTLVHHSLLGALTDPCAADRYALITVDGTSLSAGQLRGRAEAVAALIAGAKAVAVDATSTLSTVVAVVGALLAGVPVVPIPADCGPAERDYLIRDSGAQLLLSDRHSDEPPTVPVVAVPIVQGSFSGPVPHPDSPAMIVYTSGTTGAPKGVVLSYRAIAADIDALAEAWHWTPDDLLVHGLPLFHVHGLILGTIGALRVGSPVVHTGRPTPAAYAAARGSLYFGVPTIWTRICRDPMAAQALRGARLLVSGSAGLPVPVFHQLTSLTGIAPIERYGMTESLITLSTRVDGERRPGWVGVAVRGVAARVLDEHGEPVTGTPGRLQLCGATMFDGYHQRPDETAAVLGADGWLETGDVAVVDEGGFHRIVGRASTDLISSGGYRIGAGEIEDVLLGHPAVREAAVIGTPHTDLGEQVTAYVVADGVSAAELRDFVSGQLSVHKRPREVFFVDALPRNTMGKIVKKRLGEITF